MTDREKMVEEMAKWLRDNFGEDARSNHDNFSDLYYERCVKELFTLRSGSLRLAVVDDEAELPLEVCNCCGLRYISKNIPIAGFVKEVK